MANLKSAKKSIRQDKKRRPHNTAMLSELKTLTKKLNAFIAGGKTEEASKFFSVLMSKLDKAAKKNLIKRQNADRKKSRLSLKISKLKKGLPAKDKNHPV
ncbi:MAG: 30S ribosomal protein S20 [Candidatus Omnitrophica bacterium]|jgi:small subunit ribosomal protein S20|nr:30S ribosomal protein S20 [Candidatus Omnitrophota bacterium]